MADVLAKKSFLPTSGNRSWSLYRRKTIQGPSFLALTARASPGIEGWSTSLRFNGFNGRRLVGGDRKVAELRANGASVPVKMALTFPKTVKWWEKGIQPNMKDIESAQDLVDSLLNAGDRLVIVNFFSPGCAGCKYLHPKICQFAEMNPDVLFLTVNHDQHKSMCYSLHVHVLPFFQFYRGAQGRLCSFSCTNATIKKFKDALAKHTPERCSLGPTMGLEEKELLALAANKDLNFTYTPKPSVIVPCPNKNKGKVPTSVEFPVPSTPRVSLDLEEKSLVVVG